MHIKILAEVRQTILESKKRNQELPVEDVLKFLNFFEFSLKPENRNVLSLEDKRDIWRRFMQESARQNLLFDLKNSSSYYAIQRELIGLVHIPVQVEATTQTAVQLSFFFDKSKSA